MELVRGQCGADMVVGRAAVISLDLVIDLEREWKSSQPFVDRGEVIPVRRVLGRTSSTHTVHLERSRRRTHSICRVRTQ